MKPIRVAYVILAAAALANSGCLVVAAGVGAGAAAGYVYMEGNIHRSYAANLDDVQNATRTALADLGMPVVGESREGASGSLESRTTDGERVRIFLNAQEGDPAGPLTRVGVRVATFGDRPVSERLLDQIGAHLAPPGVVGTPPPPLAPTLGAPQPVPPETAAPPLATEPPRQP
jgi:Protein of unknown function (DUF3568)